MMFKDIVNNWLAFHRKKVKDKTYNYSVYLIKKHLHCFMDSKCEDIKPRDILDICLAITSKKEAKKLASILVNIFDYACTLDLIIDINPAARISKFLDPHIEKNHPALLNVNDFKGLLDRIKSEKTNQTVVNALLTIIYTAQRRQEIIAGKWSEVDFNKMVWTIPSSRMKTGKEQKIPLTTSVIDILRSQKKLNSEYIYPNKSMKKHINLTAPLVLIYNLGYKHKQTLHGFRHIFSTLSHGKWDCDVIETQLSHKIRGIRGVYNKSDYLDERFKLMSWYDDFISS